MLPKCFTSLRLPRSFFFFAIPTYSNVSLGRDKERRCSLFVLSNWWLYRSWFLLPGCYCSIYRMYLQVQLLEDLQLTAPKLFEWLLRRFSRLLLAPGFYLTEKKTCGKNQTKGFNFVQTQLALCYLSSISTVGRLLLDQFWKVLSRARRWFWKKNFSIPLGNVILLFIKPCDKKKQKISSKLQTTAWLYQTRSYAAGHNHAVCEYTALKDAGIRELNENKNWNWKHFSEIYSPVENSKRQYIKACFIQTIPPGSWWIL